MKTNLLDIKKPNRKYLHRIRVTPVTYEKYGYGKLY